MSQSHLPGLKIPPSASSSMSGRRHRCAGVQVGHRHVTASSRIVGQVSPPSSAVGIRRLVTRTRDWPSDRASSHEQVAVRGCWQVSCWDHPSGVLAELGQRNRYAQCKNVPVTSCLAGPALNGGEVSLVARRSARRSGAFCLPSRAGDAAERGGRATQPVSPRWRHPSASKDTGQPPRR